MKSDFPWLALALASCCVAGTPSLKAQTSTTQLFGAAVTQLSLTTSTYSTPATFNSTTLNLNCSASPIVAQLSGPLMNQNGTAPQLNAGALQGGGNLLVDNNILVTVTPAGQAATGPANICPMTDWTPGPSGTPYVNNCFNSSYGSAAESGILDGQNPDTFQLSSGETVDAAGGVAPIDVSSLMVSGNQQLTINLVDEGGWFAGSSLFFTTNCSQGGVTGPATVIGNPISTNPTPDQLNQDFDFNTATGQIVGFTYDLTTASNSNTLTINPGGVTPHVNDLPVVSDTFRPLYLRGTSFATAECLVHDGENDANGKPACKLFTLQCNTGQNPQASGAQCPVSTLANEAIEDEFDGPSLTLDTIHTDHGDFHEGVGLLMASDEWGPQSNGGVIGGPCVFDTSSGLQSLPCPQNLLTSFTGPGTFKGTGTTTNPNSTFISIAKVPEDRTHVHIEGALPRHWVNTSTPTVRFRSVPPNLEGSRIPGAKDFVAAPIQSINFGVSPEGNAAINWSSPAINPDAGCANVNPPGSWVAQEFETEQQFGPLADGRYLIDYYATDCAGTEELKFDKVNGSWQTSYYAHELNIDTTPPTISLVGLKGTVDASGNYKRGTKLEVQYSCSDATPGAGVVFCNGHFFAPEKTYSTGTLSTGLNTFSPGAKTATIVVVDGAGNQSSATVSYRVD